MSALFYPKKEIVILGFDLETVAMSKELIDVPTYWLKGTEAAAGKELISLKRPRKLIIFVDRLFVQLSSLALYLLT